ncbi:ABC transporter ATP-binding protein [Nocardia sp. NEAU-G5]|uniref:ABC transporter ATP-binding protein n=1 Tax=Nocardia albiluteola TaxID=2842303 RepID=A0ABS6AWS4_9NOCA|nr:ABC transporter ATP-binding protein [Nocardia albiluteola]MBU3065655.1 ABC transporter ATP-binding protein [Nocardia albiluteola]
MAVEGLTFGYGDTPILREITLPVVRSGTVTALVGPNATGKSTLLRCIAGLHRATGSIRVDGDRAVDTRPAGRMLRRLARSGTAHDQILYTPQETPPASSITVFEAVLLARRGRLKPRADAAVLDRIGQVLTQLDLDELSTRPISDLSGGQRQLVSLAQAVVRQPTVLLLDEPTSNLDLRNQLQILTLIRHLARSQPAAVIITVHDLALAARFADQIVVLHKGAVHSAGPPAETITEAMLREVYQVEATVHPMPDGALNVAARSSI